MGPATEGWCAVLVRAGGRGVCTKERSHWGWGLGRADGGGTDCFREAVYLQDLSSYVWDPSSDSQSESEVGSQEMS